MEKNGKKFSAYAFTAVFLAAVVLPGFLSIRNLISAYISDTVINNEWIAEMGGKFETDIASSFFGKSVFIDMNGAVRNLLGQREMNGVVKLDNGWLLTEMEACPEEDLRRYAENTAAFDAYLKEKGIPLVFVPTPYTAGKYDPELPAGAEDHGNENVDRFLALLDAAGVETLDLRERMREDGRDHYSMMYKTDHHWTTEAGFYVYGVLEKLIREKTGCDVDERISDIGQYDVTVYKQWHLGSRGQRTGRFFGGIDDFTLILPGFETRIQAPDGKIGTMPELIMNLNPLRDRDLTSRYTYDTVLGNGAYLGHYSDPESRNDVKILILGDSFAKAVNPYLIMGFRDVYCIYNDASYSVTPDLIGSYDPDIVIMLYYPEKLIPESPAFSFESFLPQ